MTQILRLGQQEREAKWIENLHYAFSSYQLTKAARQANQSPWSGKFRKSQVHQSDSVKPSCKPSRSFTMMLAVQEPL